MSFIWDWVSSVTGYIFNYFGYNKNATILFLGLDHAGKTTLMGLLKDGVIHQSVPTLHAHTEELTFGRLRLTAIDVGGHDQVRRIWKKFYPAVDAIVFLLDTSDRARFAKSNHELQGIMSDEQLENCPILILANKIDKHGAASETEIINIFELVNRLTGKDKIPRDQLMTRPVELFMISLTKKFGYGDAFRWLNQYI